jgi:NAD(P)-dependent dehydrogenase (short-subunit alcohol dehydrogenase family)
LTIAKAAAPVDKGEAIAAGIRADDGQAAFFRCDVRREEEMRTSLDYVADGLRCNCVCPGITDTPMLREHLNKMPDAEATLATRLRRVPIGIPLIPDDIAKAVLYLSCEDSAGVTGTSLAVDGGYLAAAEWTHPGHTDFMDAS